MEKQNFKDNFKDHEITVLEDGQFAKHFIFKKPGTGQYGFSLVTADNLIAMTGDCYELLLTPGYGRCGLAFLRGSIGSKSYFLSKCPFRNELTEYSYDEALKNLKDCVKDGDIAKEDLEDAYGLDESSYYGEFRYYEFCASKNIDDPRSPRVLTCTTLNQLAGLQCFVEKYNEMFKE